MPDRVQHEGYVRLANPAYKVEIGHNYGCAWVRTRTKRDSDGNLIQLWRKATESEINKAAKNGDAVHLMF